jgi:DNA-binding transcriptional LysR family regulator
VLDQGRHALISNSQLPLLNQWPPGDSCAVTPTMSASMRHLALAGVGIVCLADFMTGEDRARGDLVQLLARDTVEVRQSVNAVHYRNTALSSRITAFLDFMVRRLQ